ncbi:uncharacterized protein LOC113130463 [Mastacembelus armatus]|uniref:uncharacterized protein LOC113130463 n=1 Tax=Mastacembelus armatus TaxID=205130 RepID=UPI000E463499|nr:uncharacterized protein LOC113130463 [Mastacembelus armatus]
MFTAGLIKLSAALLCIIGLTNGSDVTQTDKLWKNESDAATIHCSHTKDSSYRQMYWYRQLPGEGMKQIVFTTAYSTHEYGSGFSVDKFPATKNDTQTGSLTVKKLVPEDSGVYFCAVSQHSDTERERKTQTDIMIRNINWITLLLICLSGCSLSNKVDQTPSSILGTRDHFTTISCSHSVTSYNVILWYQQPVGDSALKLIGYIQYTNPTLEHSFQQHFNVTGDGSSKSQLHVLKLRQPEDSGMYYCAASTQ